MDTSLALREVAGHGECLTGKCAAGRGLADTLGMECGRCHGLTDRPARGLCGICAALRAGMTEEQVLRALAILTDKRGNKPAIARRIRKAPKSPR